jgi:hypothetical protein
MSPINADFASIDVCVWLVEATQVPRLEFREGCKLVGDHDENRFPIARICNLCSLPADIGDQAMIRRFASWAFGLLVFAQFCGWVSASGASAEPKPRSKPAPVSPSKQQAPQPAHLYFMREKGLWATEAGIKIDDQLVGSVSKGSYFSVDRPAGRYQITCVNQVSANYVTEIQIESGHTYYFGVGARQTAAPGQNLLNQAVAGSSGQQLPATSLMSSMAGDALYQIGPEEGPAVISQLKLK